MFKKKHLLISLLIAILIIPIVILFNQNPAWADRHGGDVHRYYGVEGAPAVSAHSQCSGGSGTVASASGYVLIGGQQFTFTSADCADCEALNKSFCGCPWPIHSEDNHSAYVTSGGKALLETSGYNNGSQDLIVDPPDEVEWEINNDRQVTVYATLGENGTYDIRDKSFRDLYNNYSTKNLTYARTTQMNQLTDNLNIISITWNIHETIKMKTDFHGNTYETGRYYDRTNAWQHNKTINYQANQPELPKEKYTPFNISRENVGGIAGDSHITSSDLAGYQPGDPNVVGKIDGDTENYSGVTDGSPLSQLDINSDSKFKLSFNNKWYGLDASKNWDNTPPWDTGSQKMNPGEEYAKGLDRYIAGENDSFRWELYINGGVSDITGGGSSHLTSLIDFSDKKEYLGGTIWESDYATSTSGNWNNMFGTRAIYNDKYHTIHKHITTEGDTQFPNYWTLVWRQGKYYEYGIHYEGQITPGGIYSPHQQAYQGITSEFTVNGDGVDGTNTLNTNGTTHRGYYVSLGQEYRENPLLTGTWNVQTIAGDLAKTK